MIYVYGILVEGVDVHTQGIGNAPVRWVTANGLAAAVSDVPEGEFEEGPLNANVSDMAWLGPRALAHQEVNARLFEVSDALLPLAFGTVFRDQAGVEKLLWEQDFALRERLARVRGCAEWVVALHLLRQPDADAVAAASPQIQQLLGQIAASPPGRAHLMRQRLQTLQREESRRMQAEAATQLLDALRPVAVDVFREPLPADAVEKPLLRASLLVRRDAEPKFVEAVERVRLRWPEPAFRLLLTGPWPPYRFGGL